MNAKVSAVLPEYAAREEKELEATRAFLNNTYLQRAPREITHPV